MNLTGRYFLLFALAICQSSNADDWTVGVGGNPARNSLSMEPTAAALPIVRWQGSLNAVVAQQAVIEGTIVAMARIGDINDVLHGTLIVAHDLLTGDTLWTAEVPVDFPSSDWRSRVSSIRDGRVYATRAGNTNASFLFALDSQTGAILWRSEAFITESTTEGATFAPDGDVVTTGINSVIRINSEDGTTVWETARTCPTTGGCDPIVSGDRVYLWEAGALGPVITAFDLETGDRLFSSEGIGGGFIQQVAPFAGPDGTIYAPRTQNNPLTDYIVALKDTGSGFSEQWRVPLGFVPFASFGVGPDGSVYSYSRTNRLIRIDPLTGTVIDSSEVIVSDFYQPRMAIDSDGLVYVTNGGFGQGAVYAFTGDLVPLWSEPLVNVNVGGPAIGQTGILIVCGTGTDVRAYQYSPVSVGEAQSAELPPLSSPMLDQNYPNPFNGISNFEFRLPALSGQEGQAGISELNYVSLKIYDLLGREVATLVNENLAPGSYKKQWDAFSQTSGVYYYRLQVGDFVVARKLMLLR